MNLKRSETLHQSAKSALEFARSELKRVQKLLDEDRRLINRDELDRAKQMERVRSDEMKAAGYGEEIAKIELAAAKASLGDASAATAGGDVFKVHAPVSGKVLRVLRQDAGVVAAGTPLVELGDPKDLEIHVNVLSTEATRIQKDARVIVEGWGGDEKLDAKVRQVEPAAVTGVSPLGVAEQRVKVIVEFDKPSNDVSLGDNFSVQVRIVEWESAEVVQVPTSALVGSRDNRSVFLIEGGKAVRRAVKTGHENSRVAEVLEGLNPGDTVVAYPSDRVADGVTIAPMK
jgi:HlyD family secretion protein